VPDKQREAAFLSRPNIVYLHSHDTGRYVQPYGHAVPTPHIQLLAEQGVLFRQAFCAAPTCSPSRAALLTGQCAHSSGMLGLAHRGFALHDCDHHLAQVLKRSGYRTVLAGMQHVAASAQTVGYDQALEAESRGADAVSTAAAAFLDSGPEAPFFLDVGYAETHLKFPEMPPEDWRYALPPAPLPDTPKTRQMTAGFKESARRMDEGHGRVLEALGRNGLVDDTLVICTTDHGIAFPGMKCHLTDHGMGVMLIVRGPGGFDGGRVCDALISHLDLFPTLCDLVDGLDHPAWLEGQSLMPLIQGEREEINEEVFAEVTFHASYEPQRAVRTCRWKYIRQYGDRGLPVLTNCDDSPAKEVWLDHGWRERPVDAEQLYDLVFDPNESNNLASRADMESVLEEMRQRLQRWMTETDDPLLMGDVSPPTGAKINDADGLSPREEPRQM